MSGGGSPPALPALSARPALPALSARPARSSVLKGAKGPAAEHALAAAAAAPPAAAPGEEAGEGAGEKGTDAFFVQLASSPSHRPSNLATNGESLCYISRAVIHCLPVAEAVRQRTSGSGGSASGDRHAPQLHRFAATNTVVANADDRPFTQAAWCCARPAGTCYLVATTANGWVKVFGENGGALVSAFQFRGTPPPAARGIGSFVNADGTTVIVAGASTGEIVPLAADGDSVRALETFAASTRAVTAIAANDSACAQRPSLWASGDAKGTVRVWNDLAVHAEWVLHPDFPVSALALRDECVFAAFGNGTVEVLDARAPARRVSIDAHTQHPNALALHPSRFLFASVADDRVLAIWDWSGFACRRAGAADSGAPHRYAPVSLVYSCSVSDFMLCGAVFCGDDGNLLALAPFDVAQLAVWSIPAHLGLA